MSALWSFSQVDIIEKSSFTILTSSKKYFKFSSSKECELRAMAVVVMSLFLTLAGTGILYLQIMELKQFRLDIP